MAGEHGFLYYVGRAFINRWNLLFLGATGAFAALAAGYIDPKWFDVIGSLAAAAEVVYLAALSTNERFRNVVDAGDLQDARETAAPSPTRNAYQLLDELDRDDQQRFQRLRNQCLELRRVADGVKGRAGGDGPPVVTDIQLENINRLLWIYLKLLYAKRSLETFFRTINEQELRASLDRTGERLAALGPEAEDTPQEVKHRTSLLDTQRTSEMRLKNYAAAKENYEFLQLELERLHAKISGIAEMAVNRQDTNFITNEIDVVSTSVLQTEKTVRDLESLTGFSIDDKEAPSLLDPSARGRDAELA